MITFKEAYGHVLDQSKDFGMATVPLNTAMGRVLAESVYADRDFPPFDRATKDGIVISYAAIEKGITQFGVEGVIPAGTAQTNLEEIHFCMEIMTGAVVPEGADTVIMYEDISIANGKAQLKIKPIKGQNIHRKGTDERKGAMVLEANTKLSAAEIGVLASVGKAEVRVRKLPRITVLSTGNELVEVTETPLAHQIRKSNVHVLFAALSKEQIIPGQLHMLDNKRVIEEQLSHALRANDVLLLSGGVSKGKYDFIPEVLDILGVKKIFHRVLQRPGKPFWFGIHEALGTLIFSFPGNPVSTFANYHVYFKDWFNKSLGLPIPKIEVILKEDMAIGGKLTRFVRAKLHLEQGALTASLVRGNGSGDLTSLAKSDGFVRLDPEKDTYIKGMKVPFIPTRNIL